MITVISKAEYELNIVTLSQEDSYKLCREIKNNLPKGSRYKVQIYFTNDAPRFVKVTCENIELLQKVKERIDRITEKIKW